MVGHCRRIQLAFRQYGSAGPPLIILHGLFGSRENWHSVCLKLAPEFRVFALDQRNHGESPHCPVMDYARMAEDVREFLTQHRLEAAHVLGHSMGGKTAMQLALLHPSDILSLISVDIAPRAYSPLHADILKALQALELWSFHSRQQMERALEPAVPDLATRRFLLKNVSRTADGAFKWRLGLAEIAGDYARLSEPVTGRAFSGPALFIRGEKSDYLGEKDMPEIRRLFPNARIAVVPQAGHLVHVENQTALLDCIIEFLHGQAH